MSGAAIGHANRDFVRVAGLFQEASRSRDAIFARLGQTRQTGLYSTQVRKNQV